MIGVYAINGFHAPIDRYHNPKSFQLKFFLENLLDDLAHKHSRIAISFSTKLGFLVLSTKTRTLNSLFNHICFLTLLNSDLSQSGSYISSQTVSNLGNELLMVMCKYNQALIWVW